ncbi:MAG TPA: FliI/YscN family ATPase [Povalibacter sp.]|nr:FliI/YscN family ATPase [Povalibacter sp.]
MNDFGAHLRMDYLAAALDDALVHVAPMESRGRVLEAVGTLIKASGIAARIGDLCELRNAAGSWRLRGEVVGVAREAILLMPFGDLDGISAHTEVINLGHPQTVIVGPALYGRIVDGFGRPLDARGPVESSVRYPVRATAPDPLTRRRICRPLLTGVRAIDGLLTCGEGQRVGIFAPAGTGKSTLLSMIARDTEADVVVVGLVGERGREVGEFLHELLSAGRAERSVCVVATSDRPAVERAKAANVATAIAEYFRDQGQSVLLLLDSVTRYARALREIGLAAGEPPTRRGFPPSVFAALPRLFERAGQSASGAISAFYTVLVDDDESGDPIGEEMRAILDGHIVLSRKLAGANHYPAIDIAASRSRVMPGVTTTEWQQAADEARDLLARYDAIELLLQIGEYRSGNDARADKAVRCREGLQHFLYQGSRERSSQPGMLEQLRAAVSL